MREYATVGGWYSSKKPRFNRIMQCSFVCCYSHNEGQRLEHWVPAFNQRILRHFTLLCLEALGEKDIEGILRQQMRSLLDMNMEENRLVVE